MSYSLYTHGNNNNNRETHRMTDTEIIDVYPSESTVTKIVTKFIDHKINVSILRQKEKQEG